jgi:site-specific DNA recombinase
LEPLSAKFNCRLRLIGEIKMKCLRPSVRFDRVSSEEQLKGFSLDAQEDMGQEYAHKKGLKYLKIWSVDESASKEDERKHFFEMFEFVREKNIKDVVFDKIDRACRGFKSAVVIEELVDKHDVKFHFTRENLIIDRSSPPSDKLRFYLGTILGKYYIDNLRTEVNKGMEARLKVGLWNHRAPFGYKNIRVGKDERAIVVPDEITAPVVKEMFELYSTGNYPWSYFVKLLHERFSERKFSRCLVEELLRNPFYYGDMRVSGGRIIKGAHKPLISKKVWDQCQKIRGIRAANHQTIRNGTIPKPLMGFMTCGVCGHAITGETKRKPSGKVYIYYHCAKHSCEQHSMSTEQSVIFEQIGKAFEPFSHFTPEITQSFIHGMEAKLNELDLYTLKKTSELAQKRNEVKEGILKLESMYKEGTLSESEHQEVLKVKRATLERIKDEIDAHNEADMRTFKEGAGIIELFFKLHNFMKLNENELEKMRIAKLVLSNPTLTNRTLRFDYQKPFDVFTDLTGGGIWCGREDSNL